MSLKSNVLHNTGKKLHNSHLYIYNLFIYYLQLGFELF